MKSENEIIDTDFKYRKRIMRKAWIITTLLVVFQMVNFADKAVLGLVAESVMSELGMTSTQFGFIGSSFFFLFAISGIIVGFVAEKIQTRWIILVMGLSWAILQFPMLFGGGAMALLVTRIVLGAAEGPASSISLTHVQSWFEPSSRGFPSSLVASGTTLGPVIAAPILAYIIAHPDWGWRWAFGFLGAVGLIWTILWAIVFKEGPYSHFSKEKTLPIEKKQVNLNSKSIVHFVDDLKPVPFFKILNSKMFYSAFLAGLGCFWSLGFLTTWTPKYIAALGSFSPEVIATVSSFPWIMGALSLAGAGYISRILMRKDKTVHVSLGMIFGSMILISGICFFLIPMASNSMCIILITIAAGFAMCFPLATMAVGFSVCSQQRAAVMATLVATASIGGIVSPTMVGYLMDTAGYIQPAKGIMVSKEMAENLIRGVNIGFNSVGIYMIIIGIFTILFLNPDGLARKLMK